MTNPTLEAALRYAKLGLPVFPCRGKRPITPNGWHDGSRVPEVIRSWFSTDESLSVAAAIPQGHAVLDIDGPDGEQALKDHNFYPPDTATVKTGRGRHLWYIWNAETPPLRKIGFLPHVDLLTSGYALMPPSQHIDGGHYEWEVEFAPESLEIAPDWLVTTCAEVRANRNKIEVDEFFTGLPEGQRQTGLFRYACRLRGIPRMTRTEAKVLVRELAARSEGAGYERYPDTDALVDRVWKTYDAAIGVDEKEEGERVWSLADLLSEVHDPPNYLVDKLLPGVGYTILFAAQGAGKSVFADQVAASIATGRSVFGRSVRQSGVLVLDVEQDPNGAADRWRKLFRGLFIETPPANLYTAFSWPPLDDGGFQKIGDFLVEHPHVQLVVVDTLAQATTLSGEGGGNAYFTDSKAMGKFTRFAKEYGIAFLVIHHSRKSQGTDNFADMASGSRGITGPARARWGLTVDEASGRGTLQVGGKLPSCSISMTFDKENLLWR